MLSTPEKLQEAAPDRAKALAWYDAQLKLEMRRSGVHRSAHRKTSRHGPEHFTRMENTPPPNHAARFKRGGVGPRVDEDCVGPIYEQDHELNFRNGKFVMKRGTKPGLPSIREERGTLRPDRGDMDLVELVAPDDMPQMPDWLTTAGQEVWMDDVARVAANRLVSERDTSLFGTCCNLQGANIMAWRAGAVPPIAAIAEVRRLAEFFGIAGAKSRVVKIDKGGPSGKPLQQVQAYP